MQEECSGIWIERMIKKIPVPYPIVSIIVTVIIYLTYRFFSIKVAFFPWEFYHSLEISALSVLIGFELAGIQYLLNNTKKIFREIKSSPINGGNIYHLHLRLEQRLYGSNWYYAIVAAVVIPKMTIELTRILSGGATYYTAEKTLWGFLLDVYNYAMVYLMVFLLAIILWIIFNIAWALNEIGSDTYKHLVRIDIFSADKIGGLKPLRDFILKVHTFYFICITLAIIFFINPFSVLSYNSFFLIILLLIGIGFFFIGLRTIRKIFRGRIEDEINKINERYHREHQKLMDFISDGNYSGKGDELNLLSTALETLYNDRERMLQLYSSSGYDFMTIVEFISSFIFPLAAFLEKIYDIGLQIKTFLGW